VNTALATFVVLLFIHWVYLQASLGHSRRFEDRQLFQVTAAYRVISVLGVLLCCGVSLPVIIQNRWHDWWVPALASFMFLFIVFTLPGTIIVDDTCISETRFGVRRKINWDDVASVVYRPNTGTTVVYSSDGRTITHSRVHVDRPALHAAIVKYSRFDRIPTDLDRPPSVLHY
jgi:hypothetical protein